MDSYNAINLFYFNLNSCIKASFSIYSLYIEKSLNPKAKFSLPKGISSKDYLEKR